MWLLICVFRYAEKGNSRVNSSRLRSDRRIRCHRKGPARLQPEEVGEEALGGNG